MTQIWVTNRRLRNTVISAFTIIFRSCSLLLPIIPITSSLKNRRTKYFHMFLQMVLVSSLKVSGKLLSKAQNGVKATIYATRSLETMFRVFAFSVRPSGRGQHVQQPQKSASHDVPTDGTLTELTMTLLDQTRPEYLEHFLGVKADNLDTFMCRVS